MTIDSRSNMDGATVVDDLKLTVAAVEVEDAELVEALRSYVPDSDAEKRLVRKIDRRMIPALLAAYLLNYLDRTNIGNAKIAGMGKDLDLNDDRYAWVLSIFFFGYLICEVPSNMVLSRSRPSWFLPTIMFVWGGVSCFMALAKSYGSMLALRFILGCIESGFFPGVLYVLSCWYKKNELGKRFALFYTASVLAGAVGGLLAGGITSGLEGVGGIRGWRWLFIIEGLITVIVAVVIKFILLDFPSNSKALTLGERQLATLRIIADGKAAGASSDANLRLTHWQAFVAAISDTRTWMFLVLFMLNVGAGTISYFIPTLTVTMGYKSITAQYMTVPVYIVAAIVLNLVAWSADRAGDRRWHICASMALGCTAAVVCTVVTSPTVRYVMLCFVAAGIWSGLPLVLAWCGTLIALPAEKRAIVLAMVNAFGNFASVYGSRIWPTHDGPAYRIGWGTTAGFLGAGCVLAAAIPVLIRVFPAQQTKAEKDLVERQDNTTATSSTEATTEATTAAVGLVQSIW